MSKLVERLRGNNRGCFQYEDLLKEAADEIERLQLEIESRDKIAEDNCPWGKDTCG